VSGPNPFDDVPWEPIARHGFAGPSPQTGAPAGGDVFADIPLEAPAPSAGMPDAVTHRASPFPYPVPGSAPDSGTGDGLVVPTRGVPMPAIPGPGGIPMPANPGPGGVPMPGRFPSDATAVSATPRADPFTPEHVRELGQGFVVDPLVQTAQGAALLALTDAAAGPARATPASEQQQLGMALGTLASIPAGMAGNALVHGPLEGVANLPLRGALEHGATGAAAGAGFGSLRQTGPGESRLGAMGKDAALFAALGAPIGALGGVVAADARGSSDLFRTEGGIPTTDEAGIPGLRPRPGQGPLPSPRAELPKAEPSAFDDVPLEGQAPPPAGPPAPDRASAGQEPPPERRARPRGAQALDHYSDDELRLEHSRAEGKLAGLESTEASSTTARQGVRPEREHWERYQDDLEGEAEHRGISLNGRHEPEPTVTPPVSRETPPAPPERREELDRRIQSRQIARQSEEQLAARIREIDAITRKDPGQNLPNRRELDSEAAKLHQELDRRAHERADEAGIPRRSVNDTDAIGAALSDSHGSGRAEWARMKAEGATDAEILAHLGRQFGTEGGYMGGGISYWHHGGANPRLEIPGRDPKAPGYRKLQGKALAAEARRFFGIPEKGKGKPRPPTPPEPPKAAAGEPMEGQATDALEREFVALDDKVDRTPAEEARHQALEAELDRRDEAGQTHPYEDLAPKGLRLNPESREAEQGETDAPALWVGARSQARGILGRVGSLELHLERGRNDKGRPWKPEELADLKASIARERHLYQSTLEQMRSAFVGADAHVDALDRELQAELEEQKGHYRERYQAADAAVDAKKKGGKKKAPPAEAPPTGARRTWPGQTKSGRAIEPPKLRGRVENRLKQIDDWLVVQALEETKGGNPLGDRAARDRDFLHDQVKSLVNKKLQRADRDALNEILFGDAEGVELEPREAPPPGSTSPEENDRALREHLEENRQKLERGESTAPAGGTRDALLVSTRETIARLEAKEAKGKKLNPDDRKLLKKMRAQAAEIEAEQEPEPIDVPPPKKAPLKGKVRRDAIAEGRTARAAQADTRELLDKLNELTARIQADQGPTQWTRYDDDVGEQRSGEAGGSRGRDDRAHADVLEAELHKRGMTSDDLTVQFYEWLEAKRERESMEREDVGGRGADRVHPDFNPGELGSPRPRDADLFGEEQPDAAPAQGSMFDERAGTEATRSTAEQLRAIEGERDKLRTLIKGPLRENRAANARLAELDRVLERDRKIGADEMSTRARAEDLVGERDLEEPGQGALFNPIDDLSARRAGMPKDLQNDLNLIDEEKAWHRAVTTPGSDVVVELEGGEEIAGRVVKGARDPVNGTGRDSRALVRHEMEGQPVERWYRATQLRPDKAPSRVAELERKYGSDEALGVRYNERSEFSELPDGGEAGRCTDCANFIARQEPPGTVKVMGYEEGANPTETASGARDPKRQGIETNGGHDFAIVEGRYLVDPWAVETAQTSDRAVFDLTDAGDRQRVRELYGDPETWEKAGDVAPASAADLARVREQLREGVGELEAPASPRGRPYRLEDLDRMSERELDRALRYEEDLAGRELLDQERGGDSVSPKAGEPSKSIDEMAGLENELAAAEHKLRTVTSEKLKAILSAQVYNRTRQQEAYVREYANAGRLGELPEAVRARFPDMKAGAGQEPPRERQQGPHEENDRARREREWRERRAREREHWEREMRERARQRAEERGRRDRERQEREREGRGRGDGDRRGRGRDHSPPPPPPPSGGGGRGKRYQRPPAGPSMSSRPVPPPLNPRGQVKSLMTIGREFSDALGVTVRQGRFNAALRKALGIFKVRPETIRTIRYDMLDVVSHEVGHFMSKRYLHHPTTKGAAGRGAYPLTRAALKELLDAGRRLYGARKPAMGYAEEGIAEWTNFYVTDPARLATELPEFTKFMESVAFADHPRSRGRSTTPARTSPGTRPRRRSSGSTR
jgi:hypothetical protein